MTTKPLLARCLWCLRTMLGLFRPVLIAAMVVRNEERRVAPGTRVRSCVRVVAIGPTELPRRGSAVASVGNTGRHSVARSSLLNKPWSGTSLFSTSTSCYACQTDCSLPCALPESRIRHPAQRPRRNPSEATRRCRHYLREEDCDGTGEEGSIQGCTSRRVVACVVQGLPLSALPWCHLLTVSSGDL